mgnify:FL=1
MDITSIIFVTLKISVLSTIISFITSVFLSLFVLRYKKFTFLIDVITTLPLALPPVITGYFIIYITNGYLAFDWIGGSIACSVISLPLVYRTIFVSVNSVDKSMINTSRILGANKIQTLILVILPSIKVGIISSIFLGFIRSISEFGATMIVSGNISGKTQTLSTGIYTSIQNGDNNNLIILAGWSIFLALITIIIFTFIRRKQNVKSLYE